MKSTLAALLACGALAACGLAHGYLTDRWSRSDLPALAAARYPDLPLRIGDWEGQDIDAKGQRPDPALAGCLQRRYVHRGSGKEVVIALFCGRPKPVSIHTPDVCYGASGYHLGPTQRVAAEGGGGELWTADARKSRAAGESRLRLYWCWSDGGDWVAPANARVAFTHRPAVLHKLYVLREIDGDEAGQKEEPCQAFLRELLPELRRTLFDTP